MFWGQWCCVSHRGKYCGKLPNRQALAIGVFAFVVDALYTIAVLIIQPHWLFVEIGFFTMLLLMGVAFPAISSLAMESERQYAGSASALLGFAPFFLGGIRLSTGGYRQYFLFNRFSDFSLWGIGTRYLLVDSS